MIQIASPSNITPNKFLTVCIQAPARGSNVPADSPTASSGTPMPRAMANRALPAQQRIARLVDIEKRAASGAATQGPTIRADSTPMMNTPQNVPPFTGCLCPTACSAERDGSCSS